MLPETNARTVRHRHGLGRAWLLAGVLAISAAGVGACSTAGQSPLPSLAIPSVAIPSVSIPSLPIASGGSPLGACVDAATFAILQQLKAPGADVQGILTANKDALINGLKGFQPADPATASWRDALVAALTAGDMTAAATQVAMLTGSQISVTSC
jgi:hypothetical protein